MWRGGKQTSNTSRCAWAFDHKSATQSCCRRWSCLVLVFCYFWSIGFKDTYSESAANLSLFLGVLKFLLWLCGCRCRLEEKYLPAFACLQTFLLILWVVGGEEFMLLQWHKSQWGWWTLHLTDKTMISLCKWLSLQLILCNWWELHVFMGIFRLFNQRFAVSRVL